jgi:hypothetical protein
MSNSIKFILNSLGGVAEISKTKPTIIIKNKGIQKMSDLDNADNILRRDNLSKCAAAFGGVNYFLQLLEAIRGHKPHPLTAKNCEFRFALGTIKWGKVIFDDKLTILLKARQSETKNGNLLPSPDDKSYKNVMNLVRALNPIVFEVKPKNIKDGEGFSVHPFDVIDENVTRLNPVFDALFFRSLDTVKKILT